MSLSYSNCSWVIKKLNLLFSIVLIVLFNGCFKDEWKEWVYPDKSDLGKSKFIGEFNSLEECRIQVRRYISLKNLQYIADYECGLNCKYEYGINICKETRR